MLQQNNTRWTSFESMDALKQGVCDAIVKSAHDAIAKRGRFSIVLAGGNTPRAVYSLLRDLPIDWDKWHLYHGDERCLPAAHEDRNSFMVQQALSDYVPIPKSQIHDIPAELGAIKGAQAYAQILHNAPIFDLVLLGLGEDGHTASLFPHHPVDNSADAVPVFNSPKPPSERISMSQQRLSHAHQVIFIVAGAGKQAAVNDWRQGVAIPATLIKPEHGVEVYCCELTLI